MHCLPTLASPSTSADFGGAIELIFLLRSAFGRRSPIDCFLKRYDTGAHFGIPREMGWEFGMYLWGNFQTKYCVRSLTFLKQESRSIRQEKVMCFFFLQRQKGHGNDCQIVPTFCASMLQVQGRVPVCFDHRNAVHMAQWACMLCQEWHSKLFVIDTCTRHSRVLYKYRTRLYYV